MFNIKLGFGGSKTGRKPDVKLPDIVVTQHHPNPDISLDVSKVEINKNAMRKHINSTIRTVQSVPQVLIMGADITIASYEDMKIDGIKINSDQETGLYTLSDSRMGTIDSGIPCSTCSRDANNCPGHDGYIDLVRPIYHPIFITQVIQVLKSVCNSCSRLLLDDDELRAFTPYIGKARIKMISEASVKRTCHRGIWEGEETLEKMYEKGKNPGESREDFIQRYNINIGKCPSNPEYISSKVQDSHKIFFIDPNSKEKEVMSIDRIYNFIFANIPDGDLKKLGFNTDNGAHPRNFIMSAIPVMPPRARPPRPVNGKFEPDYITEKYTAIIKANNAMIASTDESKREELTDKIFRLFREIVDRAERQNSGSQKSIKDRLQSKDGFMRKCLMGARGNFSARTVLGPDPNLRVNQIGIPSLFAPYLTTEEVMCTYNESKLKGLLEQGKVRSVVRGRLHPNPGIRYDIILNDQGKPKRPVELRYGDKVERHLMNGDMIMFNRQPTLHRKGMMAHEVVLYKDRLTIGTPLQVTPAYNADYDGDEGNLHALMNVESMSEALVLMNVRDCLSMVGLVMDSVTGAYLLTDPTVMIERDLWWRCINATTSITQANVASLFERCDRYYIPRYSGQSLFSALLPENFVYDKDDVSIKEGVLVSGRIRKAHVGVGGGRTINQLIEKEYGQDRTIEFLSDAAFLITEWLNARGFSVGLADCIPKNYDELKHKRDMELAAVKMRIEALGPKRVNLLQEEEREMRITGELAAYKQAGQVLSKGIPGAINDMIEGQAKGGRFNAMQISMGLGSQEYKGRRLKQNLTGGTRNLPHFLPGSEDIEARGFIKESFFEGLPPAAFFFHHQAGREGLIDTAVNTSVSGDIQHRLSKAMENIKIAADGSVRTINGLILQEVYGNDGFNAETLIGVSGEGGSYPSFIDLSSVCTKINNKYGWIKEPKKPEEDPTKLSNAELYRIAFKHYQERSGDFVGEIRELAARGDIDSQTHIVTNPESFRKQGETVIYDQMVEKYRQNLNEWFLNTYRDVALMYQNRRGDYVTKMKELARRGYVEAKKLMLHDPEAFDLTEEEKLQYQK